MSWERHGGLRSAIARLAADIMYSENVKQYFTAKRIAAKRILGHGRAKNLRYRPHDLPSNGEIRDALLELAELMEGDTRTQRLFAMRVIALETMQALERFSPRLIGSVATGHVRRGSDIDLHVFAEDVLDVIAFVKQLGWAHEVNHVSILKNGVPMDFTHVLIEDAFSIELTIHGLMELRHRPRSSTDGKPITRLSIARVKAICEAEHSESWARYLDLGELPSFDSLRALEGEGEVSATLESTLIPASANAACTARPTSLFTPLSASASAVQNLIMKSTDLAPDATK